MIKNYDPKTTEPEILKFWDSNKIYAKAKDKNKGKKQFYFLDGPPYTSGRIHLGQAWNKALKDCVLRYKRMKGLDVWDRAGYDMHGLPTAHKVEEKFKIKNKDEIPKFGVAKFVEECKKLSLGNLELMSKDFIRLGVWMDFEDPYKTIENSFMEGEWWLVKKAHENKRLYEGKKTMQWCAKCATALAKHELEYKNVKENSIFVKFKVKGTDNEYLVIWTTTPWTLAFNLAVMVNPGFDYVKAKVENEIWIVAKGLVGALISGVANKKFEIVSEFKGEGLKGLKYEHPWSDEIKPFAGIKSEKLHTVVMSKEYVDLSSGSGLVHCAPGCGPEDYEVGHKEGLPPFNNIDESGVFPDNMGKFKGLVAKKDDKNFVDSLEEKGVLIAVTPVEHEYAHCWRCHKPVIFRTTKQWFFKVEDLKEKMRELNKEVFWQPDWAGNNWFDSWLDNLRDNGITRQRYWGTPLPIWKCDKCGDYTVVGSIKELKELAGKVPDDLHRPYIDEITIKCKCGSEKKRIPDILDVWIDAGTTSWSCLDYPQKEELFKKLWPADFILEGKDQIRGWFNLLLVASMISMKKHSYKAVYMHGFVSDAQGRKMSKSLGNVISPYEVIDKHGADTLRYYMIGGANPGVDLNYNFEDVKIKSKNLRILWNLHKYSIDLTNNYGVNPTKLKLMDKKFSTEETYIISKLNSTIKKVTEAYGEYRVNEAPLMIEELFLELSRTYIQLTRDKLTSGNEEDKKVVAYSIYEVLLGVLKLFSTIAPFITEAIYQNLKETYGLKTESIHLYDWPSFDEAEVKPELERNMDIAQSIVQSVLSAREKISLGVRWPLKEIVIVTRDKGIIEAVEKLEDSIKTQSNVKEIRLQERLSGLKLKVTADYSSLGPDFGDLSPKIIAKLSMDSPETIMDHVEKEGKYTFKVDSKEVNILKKHLKIQKAVPEPFEEAESRYCIVYLNKERNMDLDAEGYAREVMRRVQSSRKKAGLQKKDRITLFLKVSEDLKEMLSKWESQIKDKVGADKLKIDVSNPARKLANVSKEKVKGKEFEIHFDKTE
ncbi:isoleucine--tRNA ligase, partial [Candidatus Woesearchaeota archaeon]|nr:isoleucine--tRNA ligase [Candidatus Woesearchaeota archaeon]